MIAHTQTLFGSIALVAVITGSCLALAGQLNSRDGMLTTGLGMLSHALAYVGYTLFGHAPMWLTYVLANTLLSAALAFYTVSIPLIRGKRPPWRRAFALPLLLGVVLSLLINTEGPRQLSACAVLLLQCMIIIYYSHQYALPAGRAHRVLMLGAAVSLLGLGIRVVVILNNAPVEMHYDVSNLKQTISIAIGAVTIIMLSFGLVLLSRERIEADLKSNALNDPLTGIGNRLSILEQLQDELERSQRSDLPLSVVMLDIDHFKQINDQHGHLAGDQVLRHCVQHLQHRLRRTDRIGRYGGEEFLLLLHNTDALGALDLIKELRQSLNEAPAVIEGKPVPVSFSAGICTPNKHTPEDVTSVLLKADGALYKAKNAGRNTQMLAEAI
ncbi:GGDEF domain-containing protein [Pseudomonas sp. 5P_3.1_Bac2]|uniref:GGDEF domain-containing protein n=1 Tax=Pseudomonas sp. 5P_3.1_Bac2 TaxID=2971617 RepID=UPI0021C90067|nr:GGDEF domain-containing protein [Pseudomonas sp. 5P_3.1_Bac2]MCU1716156.1 GGDEF domain-containing protein [Pseudomonas sp. 5P_3.1_Bac2]